MPDNERPSLYARPQETIVNVEVEGSVDFGDHPDSHLFVSEMGVCSYTTGEIVVDDAVDAEFNPPIDCFHLANLAPGVNSMGGIFDDHRDALSPGKLKIYRTGMEFHGAGAARTFTLTILAGNFYDPAISPLLSGQPTTVTLGTVGIPAGVNGAGYILGDPVQAIPAPVTFIFGGVSGAWGMPNGYRYIAYRITSPAVVGSAPYTFSRSLYLLNA